MSVPEGKPGERRYGRWVGRPDGWLEDPDRCIETIHSPRGFVSLYGKQCSRKRGHGPNGEFCKQHAKRYERKDEA